MLDTTLKRTENFCGVLLVGADEQSRHCDCNSDYPRLETSAGSNRFSRHSPSFVWGPLIRLGRFFRLL